MANSWFRMYAEFLHDSKVQMLCEADQRRYIMLLCIKCNGDETLHDDEIAFQLRISNEEWSETKQRLIDKKLIDDSAQPLAWNKRQYLSDSSTERVRAYRERMKQGCNVSETPPDTDTDTEDSNGENSLPSQATPATDNCPHKEIVNLFHEMLPSARRVRVWSSSRQDSLRTRWRESKERQSLEWWRGFFGYIAKSDFLMGRAYDPKRKPFELSLDWALKHENFIKIIEGAYEN